MKNKYKYLKSFFSTLCYTLKKKIVLPYLLSLPTLSVYTKVMKIIINILYWYYYSDYKIETRNNRETNLFTYI